MRNFPAVQVACIAALTLPWPASAQVHRCSINGATVLQDKPCVGSTPHRLERPGVVIPKPSGGPPIGDPAYEREKEAKRRKDLEEFGRRAGQQRAAEKAALETALHARCGDAGEGEPFIGASAAWVRACSTWGEPSRVNSTTSAMGTTQQWVYRYRGHLYFDGRQRLVTIQR